MDVDAASWVSALAKATHWEAFLSAAPKRPTVTDAQARTLSKGLDAGAKNVKGVFQKVYPDLQTAGLPAKWGFNSVEWPDDKVKRLFQVLTTWAPVAHVQSARNGFFLCDKRHGSRSTRIYLQNVHAILLYSELDVHQPFDRQSTGEENRVMFNGFQVFRRDPLRRQHTRGITGMYSCFFNMFLNARNHDRRIIGQRVDIDLGRPFQEFVD
jgi:hypothetical protein